MTVTTSVITPFFGVYYAEANIRLAPHVALLVNANHFPLESGRWKSRTTALGGGLAYYFQGTALRKWHVDAVAEVMFSSWHHERDSSQTSAIVVGSSFSALVAYRFVWDAGPVLDVGLGVARIHIPSGTASPDGERASSGAVTRYYPAPKLSVGWAF